MHNKGMHTRHVVVSVMSVVLLIPLISFARTGCYGEMGAVCGYKEKCVWGACTYYRTYDNLCIMNDARADLMHEGACEGAQKSVHAVEAQLFADEYPLLPQNISGYNFFAILSAITTRLFTWAIF